MAQKSYRRSPQRPKAQAVAVADPPAANNFKLYALACLAAFFAAFQVYAPALHGQFVFDDLFLLYTNPHAASLSLAQWCGLRPVLGLSFWANFQAAGLDTFPYHVVNVLLHCLSTILLFLIVRKILEMAGTEGLLADILSGFSAAIFLLHPIQTEAVAYIASRSETLSVLFIFAAFYVFLRRRSREINWAESAAVLFLFACAAGTKEHAVALPAVFLLTDYFWNPGFTVSGIRANWRLYVPTAFVGTAAVIFVWSYVSRDATIGFHIGGLTWYQYFFTQSRALFGYIWYFLVPIGLNVDHEFAASRTITDHGAIIAMLCLAALVAAAIYFRRRFPLACYGFFVFLVLIAPTSSVVPIRDVFVERRLYLPFIGLMLIALEPLRRLRMPPKTIAILLACLCVVPAFLTWRRTAVWTSSTRLWEDSVQTAPNKPRPHIGLGNAYMHEQRCHEAAKEYEAAYALTSPDFTLKYNLAAAYECIKQPARAIAFLKDAISENPSAAPNHALMGMVQAETGKWEEGLAELKQAEQLDPNYARTYAYRGVILATLRQNELASREFEKCLQLDPNNQIARRGWNALNPDGGQ